MRKRLRNLLSEIMADGQEHSLPELKDAIRQKTGLVYKQDYFESHWSGAIKDLRSDGRIRRLERGKGDIRLRVNLNGISGVGTYPLEWDIFYPDSVNPASRALPSNGSNA